MAYYTVEPKFDWATKEEFETFILNYPHTLERDFYMGCLNYNDFSIADAFPESVVAVVDVEGLCDSNDPQYARIMVNYQEVIDSVKI